LFPTIGVAGIVFITTFTVLVALLQPFAVATTEYTPAVNELVVVMVGFCTDVVNELGPLQL
jgi:hypothetical protein